MATASVIRPVHRRQGSEVTSPPALPALGSATSTVTLDGRLLEIQDVQQRGRAQKDDDGRPTKVQPKGAVARPPPLARAPPDKAPMTPPRVSGVSLAPLPNLEHHTNSGAAPSGEKSPGASGGVPKLQRRPSITTHVPLGGKAPPPPAAVAAACCGATAAGGACGAAAGAAGAGHGPNHGHSQGHGQLIAEGRGIVRNVTLDPWVVAYMDINGTGEADDGDSVCLTPPPRINIQCLARGAAESHGAFGPLSPCPLSPSILTVCGQPGHDDQFAFNSGSLQELFDMRTCQSPKLPPV